MSDRYRWIIVALGATVSYAIACGIAPLAAVTIYSLEGLAALPQPA